jgi:hypothetical protein
MKKLVFIFWMLASFIALAEEKSPGERMMVAMGIDKVLDAQRDAYKADAKKQVAIVMKQLENTLSQLPPETSEEIETAMNSVLMALLDSWNVDTAIRIYSEEWNKSYTPSEIEKVIEKYKDPSAKKELEVVMSASAALNQYISGSYNSALEKSMAELMPKIQQAIIKGKKNIQPKNSIQPTAKVAD